MSARWSLVALIFVALLIFVTPHGLASDDDDDKPEPAPRFHAKTLEGEQFNNASIKGKSSCWIFGQPGASTAARKKRWWTTSAKNFPIKVWWS